MSTTADTFTFPTSQGDAVISRSDYERLTAGDGVSPRKRSTIFAAAQILQVFTDENFRTARQIIGAVYSDPAATGSMAFRNGLTALIAAKLLVKVGVGRGSRYRLATPEDGDTTSEAGFSLIDVVITVAIVLALSVGGLLAYNGLVDQAKQGMVDHAASIVWDTVAVYEQDGLDSTNACTAIDEYNSNGEETEVSLTVPVPGNPSAPGLVYIGQGEANTYTC